MQQRSFEDNGATRPACWPVSGCGSNVERKELERAEKKGCLQPVNDVLLARAPGGRNMLAFSTGDGKISHRFPNVIQAPALYYVQRRLTAVQNNRIDSRPLNSLPCAGQD